MQPFYFIFSSDFERKLGLPNGALSLAIVNGGDNGAWQQLERGEITTKEFAAKFGKEVAPYVSAACFRAHLHCSYWLKSFPF